MNMSVKPGMSAEEIATLHYQLAMENKQDEWIKTIRKRYQETAKKKGSRPWNWWDTARTRVDKQGMSYKFKKEDTIQKRTDTRVKFFFHRLDKDGNPSGTGQVPIQLITDPDDNNEWRVDVSSW